jgi:SSS family solute:Na+ symporter
MNTLAVADYIIICVYVIGVLALGIAFSGRQKSMKEYFLASGTMPWWAVSLSMAATMLSPISFLGISGWIYAKDARYFFGPALLLLISLPLAACLWVPIWSRLQTASIYPYLERRYHPGLRTFAAALFMIQMTFWVGNGLVTASEAFADVTPLGARTCLVGIILLGTLYTMLGGSRAVIWTDVAQTIVFVFAFIVVGGMLLKHFDWQPMRIHQIASAVTSDEGYPKTQLFSTEFRLSVEATIWALLLAKIMEILSFGSDQRRIQRLLATGTKRNMYKALFGLAGFQLLFMILAIFVAWGFVAYYHGTPEAALIKHDAVMPHYIASNLPILVRGVIMAGLLAAMMSTFDSALNSMSSVTITDFYQRYFKTDAEEGHYVKSSRWATIAWGCVILFFALWQMGFTETTVLQRIGQLNNLILPAVAIFFILGVFTKRCNTIGVLAGALTSILLVLCFSGFEGLMAPWVDPATFKVSWVWLEGLCTALGCLVGYLASFLFAAPPEEQLTELTIYEEAIDVADETTP